MNYTAQLRKMQTELAEPIQYYLNTERDVIQVNQLLGRTVEIVFEKYECLGCGADKKIFRQGYCYDCFYALPQAGEWVMHPEKSQAHLGIADRDLNFEKQMQLVPHVVYLANSSNVKVGVTRKSQIPTRWIDQGAHEAIEILEVPNRYLAGIAEVALKEHVSDKTNWRKMLTNIVEDLNLMEWRDRLQKYLPDEVRNYVIKNSKETVLHFPVREYSPKVKSLNLEKTPQFKGTLRGIKGQYFLFENGTVFNVRNHEGFVINLSV